MNERKEEAREGGGGGMELRQYIALLLIDSVKSWRELSLMTMCVNVCVRISAVQSVLYSWDRNRAQRQHSILKNASLPSLSLPFVATSVKRLLTFR